MPAFHCGYVIIIVMRVRGLIEWAVGHFKPVMITVWGLVAACLITSAVLFVIANTSPRETLLDLSVVPSTATIKVNGEESRNGSHKVEPGEYKIEIIADGFEPKSLDIKVEKDKTNSVAVYLTNTAMGMKYYEQSEADITILRSIAKTDETAKQFIDSYDQKFSIYRKLPMESDYQTNQGFVKMTISTARYDKRCKGTLCIKISGFKVSDDSFTKQAKQMLTDKGFNLEDYEVFYEYK